MNIFWLILAIGLILVGFFFPPAWIGAVTTGLLAIAIAPPGGKRADGKRRTGGLLGGLWDDVAIARSMTDCPYCKTKVKLKATKGPNCHEWLIAQKTAQDGVIVPGATGAATESVKGNLAKLGPLAITIVGLAAMIGIGLLAKLFG